MKIENIKLSRESLLALILAIAAAVVVDILFSSPNSNFEIKFNYERKGEPSQKVPPQVNGRATD